MRWVDRGPEPAGVEDYRQRYTQAWVDHFNNNMGQPGPDRVSRWGDFRDELSDRFSGKCGYCERICDGYGNTSKAPTTDHFRPLSKFPEKAYVWSNWVFSCWRCNQEKGNLWPDSEYVDPCAISVDERPEAYFEIDILSGEVVAKRCLPAADREKALNTIRDIGLNALDLLRSRRRRIGQLEAAIAVLPSSSARQFFIEHFGGPDREYAGITGMVAERLRQRGDL